MLQLEQVQQQHNNHNFNFLLILTTSTTSRSGFGFSIAITTWPLSLASGEASTSIIQSGWSFGVGVVPVTFFSFGCVAWTFSVTFNSWAVAASSSTSSWRFESSGRANTSSSTKHCIAWTSTATAMAMAKVTDTDETERPAKRRRTEGTHCIVD